MDHFSDSNVVIWTNPPFVFQKDLERYLGSKWWLFVEEQRDERIETPGERLNDELDIEVGQRDRMEWKTSKRTRRRWKRYLSGCPVWVLGIRIVWTLPKHFKNRPVRRRQAKETEPGMAGENRGQTAERKLIMNPCTLVWRIIENKHTGTGMKKGGMKENRERRSCRVSRSFWK